MPSATEAPHWSSYRPNELLSTTEIKTDSAKSEECFISCLSAMIETGEPGRGRGAGPVMIATLACPAQADKWNRQLCLLCAF